MKNYILALVLVSSFAFATATNAQSSVDELRTSRRIASWTDADLPVYSIQISAAHSAPDDVSFFKNLDVVYEYASPDGLIKYYYGKFSTYAEANKSLASVRKNGFKEAFIVNLRGGSAKPSAVSKVDKIVTTGGKPLELDPNTDYVIQVGAYRYPLYISFFDNVGEVYEYRLNDKIFRYTTKPMKGSSVEAELARVKSLGYDKAFVVEYSLYQPYKIE